MDLLGFEEKQEILRVVRDKQKTQKQMEELKERFTEIEKKQLQEEMKKKMEKEKILLLKKKKENEEKLKKLQSAFKYVLLSSLGGGASLKQKEVMKELQELKKVSSSLSFRTKRSWTSSWKWPRRGLLMIRR